jgi:hypothetical protein
MENREHADRPICGDLDFLRQRMFARKMIGESVMRRAAMIRTVTSITRGSTFTFPAPSARGMSGASMEVTTVDLR